MTVWSKRFFCHPILVHAIPPPSSFRLTLGAYKLQFQVVNTTFIFQKEFSGFSKLKGWDESTIFFYHPLEQAGNGYFPLPRTWYDDVAISKVFADSKILLLTLHHEIYLEKSFYKFLTLTMDWICYSLKEKNTFLLLCSRNLIKDDYLMRIILFF